MRAVLVGNDYLKDNNGNFRHLESNTSVLPSFARAEDYFNKSVFDQFLLDNNITSIVIIDPLGSNFVQDGLDKQHDGSSPYQKISHMLSNVYGETHSVSFITQNQDGSLPLIEDADDKLILRIAYDDNALVDESYCKDNFGFLKLISDSNPNSLPNVFFNDGNEISVDTIGTTITNNGNHPNFIIKERYPTINYGNYPKVYRINSVEELNTLKNGLNSNELLQEYICNTNDLIDGKLKTYRHITILYGSDLSVLNPFDVFCHSNRLPITDAVDYDGTTNELSPWERPKYLQKTGSTAASKLYTGSENDNVKKSDGSLVKLKDLRVGDTLSSVILTGLGPDDESHINFVSNISDLNRSDIVYSPVFDGPFGGMSYTKEEGHDPTYNNPTTSNEWGGFANTNTELSNIGFPEGGRITFNASCEGSAQVMFLLEKDVYDANGNGNEDTEPNYTTDSVTISGTGTTKYSLEISPTNEYSSFVMKVMTQDLDVNISNTKITSYVSGLTDTSVSTDSIISEESGFFEHIITLSGGKTYTFLGRSQILSSGPNEDSYRFMIADNLLVGCKVITRELSGGNLIPETIVSMGYRYVHEVAYSIDVEEVDYYFRTDSSETPTQSVIHHNKEVIGCGCYYKQLEWARCFCNSPCIYAPGECDDSRGFIDCCSAAPICDGGSFNAGPCGDSGKE
jgi:hypothetical protein